MIFCGLFDLDDMSKETLLCLILGRGVLMMVYFLITMVYSTTTVLLILTFLVGFGV